MAQQMHHVCKTVGQSIMFINFILKSQGLKSLG